VRYLGVFLCVFGFEEFGGLIGVGFVGTGSDRREEGGGGMMPLRMQVTTMEIMCGCISFSPPKNKLN
jgi:hypothetical protein